MMEKRNFVTSGRTVDSAKDIDDILDEGARSFGGSRNVKSASDKSFEAKASEEDEKSDKAV